MKNFSLALIAALAVISHSVISCSYAAAEPIKVGVVLALTGDAATFGQDMQNAFTLMNEKFGGGRYQLIYEDDKCDNRTAVSTAKKLIDIDKVPYAIGFSCNASMLAAAPVYNRAGTLVLTSSATSGDVTDVGQKNFRLFPSDTGAAELIFKYMAAHQKKIAIITEQNEYPVMMERVIKKENAKLSEPRALLHFDFVHGETDLRTSVLLAASKGADSIFINADTDDSFVDIAKQIRTVQFQGAIYAAYLPASATVLKALGHQDDGIVFSNLPLPDALASARGKELLGEFRKRFGEPKSGFPVVPLSFEAFRDLDAALQSGQDPGHYLRSTKFSGGYIPDYYFDEHGAVQGIKFELQKIENGKAVVMKE